MKMAVKNEVNTSKKRKAALAVKFCVKQERNVMLKKVYTLLKKTEIDRSEEEKQFLYNYIDLVKEVRRRIERQKTLKDRLKEVEDPPDVISEKCAVLADALSSSRKLVVYTGAGVSTAACIPDYRGSNGIWTLLQQGKDIGLHDLSKAEPTLTHMALTQLYRVGLIKHVVSQNCDGLHLRSGLPKEAISEVHGNMYIEVCRQCQPVREYLRLFDVTENTGRFNHRTGRRCYMCSGALVDSIVHFGERGTLKWPLNWSGAVAAAASADVILCIGSSLKVLKRYPWLWGMDKNPKKRPKLYIVNLQWTPKDDQAVLKINGRCDFVMEQVMRHLQINIPSYDRSEDPIFAHATLLHHAEKHTTTKPFLVAPESKIFVSPELEPISQEILSVKYEKCNMSSNQIEKIGIHSSSVSVVDIKIKNEISSNETLCDNLSKKKDVSHILSSSLKEETSASMCVSESLMVLKGNDLLSKKICNESHELCFGLGRKNKLKNVNEIHLKKEINTSLHEDLQIKRKFVSESAEPCEPFMEIIYEGVKLKVKDNVSVEANVKIKNDILILCDTPSIHCNSFIFNSSYELEEADNDFKFVNVKRSSNSDDSEKEVHHYRECDSKTMPDTNCRKDDEISIHSNREIINFFNSSEHNYSRFSSLKEHSSFSEIKIFNSENITEVQEIAESLQTSCKEVKSCKCSSCPVLYGTRECQFYLPAVPVFRDMSVGVCECCSEGSEEEEEDVDDNGKKEDKDGTSYSIKPTNPGWYGKGYRKRIKKKR